MTIKVVWAGNVCEDCALMIANGECPDCSLEREKKVAEATAGMCLAPSEDEVLFSWRPCAACCSELGGSRFLAVKLGNGEEVK